MTAYYNEIDPHPAAWMRNLIAAGCVAAGRVDERSIRDVQPADVADATQAHFFAGIACWSYALRLAGWPDDRPVWTGSCPCQPFSVAGKRGGTADDRHLWPEWFRLIREQRPPVVFGEQVASPDGLAWLDAVSSDLEASGYAFAAADLCAAGVGAPHIRQRLYFVAYALPAGRSEGRGGARDRQAPGRGGNGVAHADPTGRGGIGLDCVRQDRDAQPLADADGLGSDGVVGDAERDGSGRHPGADDRAQGAVAGARELARSVGHDAGAASDACGMGDADDARPQGRGVLGGGGPGERASWASGEAERDPWRAVEWVPCSDGRARPAQPGVFPLAHGATARVGRLRAYGNAIVPQVAATFIRAFMEATSC